LTTSTLKDVAERAGLSISAASLALSGNPRIPQPTRERVRAAAAALGYSPNGAARALRARRHGAIGLLMFGGVEPLTFYSEAVVAVAEEALRADHQAVLLKAPARASKESDKGELARLLSQARVDGVVCIGTEVTVQDVRAMVQRAFPFIFIGKRELPGVTIPYVATDYFAGGRLATQHLLQLGHRRVAMMVTPEERHQPWIEDRLTGHAVAIGAVPGATGPVVEVPAPEDAAAGLAHRWLEDGITAAFTAGRAASRRALALCQMAGIRVPEQLALVGFDDFPGAALAHPPLTVVKQPLASLGMLAARTLLARLDGAPHEPAVTTLPATLVVRDSCGATTATAVGQVPALHGATS
jgi:DNA-binding LacI/PurR family transcriptional regulator